MVKCREVQCMCHENWIHNKNSRICSDHFKEEMIDRSANNLKLKLNAVPTMFEILQKNLKQVNLEIDFTSIFCSNSLSISIVVRSCGWGGQ